MAQQMALPATLQDPRLDHVVVDARDRMDEAARVYRALGFHVTDRSRHTLGSTNHVVVFETDYLELLGFDPGGEKTRPDLQGWPVGMNGLVFGLEQPEEVHRELEKRGVAVNPVQDFSRPVNLGGGPNQDAKFRVVRLQAGTASFGRVYFCQHLTPELIWRREWQEHANGAQTIERILVAVGDPGATAELLQRMFGEAVRAGAGNTWSLMAGGVAVDFVPLAEVSERYGDFAADPAGRTDYMAALTVRTRSIAAAAKALEAGGIEAAQSEGQRIVVPAAAAMNVTVEFVE